MKWKWFGKYWFCGSVLDAIKEMEFTATPFVIDAYIYLPLFIITRHANRNHFRTNQNVSFKIF